MHDDDGIVVLMGSVDWSLLPPSPWTDEERAAFLRRAQEDRMRRGANLSFEESRRLLERWVAQADAKRGYKLTPEEKERRFFQLVFEARIAETRRRSAAAMEPFEYRYRPPTGPLMVREGSREETQLDRIERALSASRVHLEALESKVDSFADQNLDITRKLEALTLRIDALAQTVERLDLRVLSLEHRVQRLEVRMDRLEERMDRLEERMDRLEGGAG